MCKCTFLKSRSGWAVFSTNRTQPVQCTKRSQDTCCCLESSLVLLQVRPCSCLANVVDDKTGTQPLHAFRQCQQPVCRTSPPSGSNSELQEAGTIYESPSYLFSGRDSQNSSKAHVQTSSKSNMKSFEGNLNAIGVAATLPPGRSVDAFGGRL